jgi:pyridoxamine 5'-phosphate oxidase family protein
MSNFTAKEIEYMQSQHLGRLATVSANGEPHVVPTSFHYNAELDTIDIGGLNTAATKKYRDAAKQGRAALVVDDVLPPWQPRGIEIRGRAEVVPTGGKEIMEHFAPEIIRIYPTRIISWGLEGDAYHSSSRKVE